MSPSEVLVVGCGIAGGALATALARAGRDVVVLEAQTEYQDRVRGEKLFPWGAAEAERLGVVDVLVEGAGAYRSPGARVFNGIDGVESPSSRVFADLVPGAFSLNFQHRLATEALARAAAEAGARVLRGVSDVSVSPGENPMVSFTVDGEPPQEIGADLIVGADGRNSIVRRAADKTLNRHKANHYVAGLLVEGLPDEAMGFDTLAVDDGRFVLAFPQGEGRARVYVCHDSSGKARYAGDQATEHLLEDADIPCLPFGEAIATSTPIGPCRSYPGHDTWLDEPASSGVVLVGDSAGYQSPIIATGLSSALRDARMVVEAVTDGTDHGDFREYSSERAERGRRLRFVSALYETLSTGPGAARRFHTASQRMQENPDLGRWRAAQLFGPELPPAEAFREVVYEQLTAAA